MDYQLLRGKHEIEMGIIEEKLDDIEEQRLALDAHEECLKQRRDELVLAVGQLTMNQTMRYIGSPETEVNPLEGDGGYDNDGSFEQ